MTWWSLFIQTLYCYTTSWDSTGLSAVSMSLDIYGHLTPGWQREAAAVFAKGMGQGS